MTESLFQFKEVIFYLFFSQRFLSFFLTFLFSFGPLHAKRMGCEFAAESNIKCNNLLLLRTSPQMVYNAEPFQNKQFLQSCFNKCCCVFFLICVARC